MILDAGALLWSAFVIWTTGTLPGLPRTNNSQAFPFHGLLPAAIGTVNLVAGIGLVTLARWARALTMGLAAVSLLLDLPLVVVLGILVVPAMLFDAFVLLYLRRVRDAFARPDDGFIQDDDDNSRGDRPE